MFRPLLKVSSWSGLAALVACAGASEAPREKGEAPLPSLVGGKADGDTLVVRGQLGFGDAGALQQAIPSPLRFDAFEIDLAQGGVATFEITQKGTSRGFDSLLYVYGPRDAAGSYSDEVIARDDDSGWGLLSRVLDFEAVEGGTYMLVVGSYEGQGSYRIAATCENGACEPAAPTGDCVFGASYGELVRGTPATTITAQRQITETAGLDAVLRSQLVESLVFAGFDDVTTAEQALATVDDGRVNFLQVWDASNEEAYEVLEYGLGDTSVGTIYAAGTTDRAAVISDLDIYDCEVFQGPARRDCATGDDCAAGLSCEGVVNGVGSCIDTGTSPDGEGESCVSSADCGLGLVCAGENFGGGQCNPAWMRRRFHAEPNVAIEGSITTLELDTYGLASVHTDVSLDLFLTHADLASLRVVLVNPSGTESVIHDRSAAREIHLDRVAVRGFPGDEDANGTWTLRVENDDPARSGAVYEFGLEVTSRWD